MAEESCNNLICCIERLRRKMVGHPMDDELGKANTQLESVAKLFKQLEIHNSENGRFLCKQVKTLFKEAVGEFGDIIRYRIYRDSGDDTITMMISEVVKKIKPACIARLIRASKPSRSSSCIQDTVKMKEYVDALLESSTVLLNCMNDSKTDLLKKKLISLKFLLMFIANHDLLIHAEDVAYTVAHLSFLYCDSEYVVPGDFSELLETINPIGSELRQQIYTRVSFLKVHSSSGLKTQMMISQLVEGLFCTVQVDLEQLLSRDASVNHHIRWLRQGLICLSTFLLNLSTPSFQDQNLHSLLSRIESFASEAGIVVSSFCDEDAGKTTEVEYWLAFFPLQVKFNHVNIDCALVKLHEATMMASLKNSIDYVGEDLIFLKTFLMDIPSEHCKEQKKMTDILSLVQYVTTEAGSLIDFLSHVSEEGELERKINFLHFQLLLKFKFIKAVIRLICPAISASSTPDHPMSDLLNFVSNNFEVIDSYSGMLKSSEISSVGNRKMDEAMLGFLEYILHDLRKLLHDGAKSISTLSNELKKLTQGVILLLTFLADPPIQYIKCKKRNALLIEIEYITIEVKSAICSLYEDASESRITEVYHVLFRLQVKLNQVKVESSLIEQLKYEVSMTAPLKDLIDDFQEMLISLRTFLMDSLEQCKEQHKMTDVLTVVQSVTTEAWSVISSLSRNSKREDLAGEINLLHFQLLLKFRFIKAVIRLICPEIYVSPTPDSPITNLLNFLPCNFEVIDSYFNMVKSSERSFSGIPKMDEVFMGFHKYILDNLLLKDGVNLAFTDTDKVKGFYHGLIVLVIFLIDPPIQYIECKKQNDLLEDIGTLAIEAEAAIRLTFEDALDNRKSRKVSLLLQFLTVAFKLIKCKGKLTDQLKHKAVLKYEFLDLMENAHEELIFLKGFLMDFFRQNTELGKLDNLLMLAEADPRKATSISTCSYESYIEGSSTGEVSDFLQEIGSVKVDASLCKDQTQITDILPLVQSLTTEAESFLSFISHDSEEGESGREINLLHFQLLLKFKFIKAAIQRICSIISASSKPDHPVIYPLNFLPTNFEAIDSYFTMLKSSKTLSSDSSKTDDVFMGFHEYILENLLLKDGASLKLADHGLLVLVTFLVDPPIQYIECKKQNDLLSDIGTLAIEAEAAIRLTYEDALDSRQSRKVSILLHLLTVAFKLIKSERNLMDLLMHEATLEAQILDLMENAHGELIFLRVFLMDFLRHHAKLYKVDDLLMRVEVSVDKLISSCSYESFMVGRNTGEMSLSLSDFIQEIKSINVEVRELCFQFLDESASYITVTDLKCLINMLLYMLNHLHSWDDVISVVRNQIPAIKEKLESLADILPQFNMHRELKDLMERVQNVTGGEKYVIFFSVTGDSRSWFHLLYLSDVKQVLNFVEAEVKIICSKCQNMLRINFPKTNGLGFLNCFLGKLEELLHSKLDLITELKPQILLVKEGLLCLRLNFTDYEHDAVYGLMASATEMAYKAEYVIDSCLASSDPPLLKAQWISEVVENIKIVTRDVSENCKRKKIDVNQVAKGYTKLVSSLSANTPGSNEEMVGFKDVMNKLKLQLLGGSHELDVISILGMPGLGKTTLAKKIYSDPTVVSHFDVRAVCYVTQVYSWKELLLTLLNDVLGPADRTKTEDGQLANELRQVLLTKRFLILIDDVWDRKAWDYLSMCFKSSHNKSRVILTTRLDDVADYAKCKSEPHRLRLLEEDESWRLLQEELFHGQSCPSELEDVGFRIAKSCGGLPLFIVLVAGVLKEKENQADLWKEVEETLDSHNFSSSEEGMSIIGFSYENLPNQLKPCFLYFGGFLRGKHVPVSKLSRVWLAEGFLEEDSKEKGSEDAAQGYLKYLIRRNLVMDVEKRSNGKLKTCRVHDLLHQFCVQKAKQDNFLVGIHRDQCGDSTFSSENCKEYRLSIYSKREEFAQWLPSRSGVRSLLFSASSVDSYPTMARDISFMFDCFKLLKVLDLESINIGDTFPSEIRSLIYMKYFAARTGANSIPSSIADLWNLETFVVKGLRGELKLPCSLLKMFKLRHIHVSRASFSLHDGICESPDNSQLANLETFSTPCLSYGEDAEKILRSIPNLRKMRCIFRGSLNYSIKMRKNCVLFPRLDFLNQLESLKLFSDCYPAEHPHEFNFPSKLRELTLSNFRLPWTQISTIAELPNLEILKLLLKAFEGVHWEVKDSDFPKLKCLKLDNLNIAQWSISDDAFPKLERLVITKCKQLEQIPSHFEDAGSLKSIEVNWCSWSVANSAQEIQKMQEDYGNGAFTVTIQPQDWARRSSS